MGGRKATIKCPFIFVNSRIVLQTRWSCVVKDSPLFIQRRLDYDKDLLLFNFCIFCHPSITLSYQTVAENAWKKLVGRGKNLAITESGMVKNDDTWAAPLLHGRSVFGGDLFLKV